MIERRGGVGGVKQGGGGGDPAEQGVTIRSCGLHDCVPGSHHSGGRAGGRQLLPTWQVAFGIAQAGQSQRGTHVPMSPSLRQRHAARRGPP